MKKNWKPAVFFVTDDGDYIDTSFFNSCEDAIEYIKNFNIEDEDEE